MFEFIRTHQRLMQFLLLLLILPSFVLVGVSQYEKRSDSDGVATVDGRKITQQEWEAAQRRQIEQARAMMGPQFDQKLFDTPEAKQEVLDGLVAERAVGAEVARNHLAVGNDSLAKGIIEQTGLRKPDGSFDLDAYKAFLASQGMSAQNFEQRVGYQLAVQQ
ncbi:SurA N-terminal domain-containing protein, partial [Massilia sp. LXY-6]|uniref:SurA N-terminal domain-containing protein n=1 Tax=Massilia sp. LXY-6 TaxID=3379823 RepID=UPI003EE34687